MNKRELDEVMEKLLRACPVIEEEEEKLIRQAITRSRFNKRHVELILVLSLSIATSVSLSGDLRIIEKARSIFSD